MSSSYESMTNDELQELFDVTRQNLGLLKLQEAKFGSLHVPMRRPTSLKRRLRPLSSR
jgi:hypothetical protein